MVECMSGWRGGLLWKEPLLSSLLAGFYDNMFEFKALRGGGKDPHESFPSQLAMKNTSTNLPVVVLL